MADAIPVSDPGLLAAQAKAGQAGVDAYNAAISALQGQKQSAVETALQEAAMRGAPVGAAASQSGTIATPYDQRIASLTQGLGSFQAANAGREARMNDYNAATLAARSYIPQQTEQIVAPIRANADFQVRNTQMEGEMRVAGLNADTELTLAKMRAALQASQIAAAKKAKEDAAKAATLNQGELGALMTDRARSVLQAGGNQVRGILQTNAADTLTKGNAAIAAAARTPAETNQNYWDLQAARYTGRAMQDYGTTPRVLNTSTSKDPLPAQVTRAGGQAAAGQIIGHYPTGQPIYAENAASLNPGFLPTSAQVATSPVSGVQSSNQANILWRAMMDRVHAAAAPAALQAGRATGRQSIADLQAGVTQREEGIGMRRLTAGVGSLAESNNKYAAIDEQTGRRVYMTPEQVQGLDPFAREMLLGATQVQGINGPEDFENIVWGTPSPQNRGIPNSYSADVVQNALAEAVAQLRTQGGYNITDPEAMNARPKPTSIYNLLAGQSGQPSSEEAYRAYEADQADLAKAAAAEDKANEKDLTAQEKADEEQAGQGLIAKYGQLPSKDLGTRVEVLANLVDYDAQIQQAKPVFDKIVADWDTTRGALNAGQLTTQLMQAGVNPAVIPYVLYSFGFG